ncbi:glycosyltransferase family 2 protein [Cerasicoccus arenae]|uniref:Glycosyltransferase 2-like domain-containing protein n=1 Tax=Cerasicoccus arenae TaxID=424488 RepID=A0A8J3D987_9BACT|nr:glycosyltransferase [Cerasicoccus arenae]MBK1857041.1 glycosyltransferase [Cerasicoccus arenae]GHB92022.1 hypothetical protein GCM10007047_03750 [Cerasicoccus arenae]
MSLISVIIAAYNAEEWIKTSLTSVCEQSYSELEIIVVDDGSRDATAEIITNFGDPRIRLIRQANAGQSAALNRGLQEATGSYIKFVDADDALMPGHLEAQIDALRDSPRCLADCHWGYFVEDKNLAKARIETTNRNYDDPLEWLYDSLAHNEGMMGGWKWLIPKAIIAQAGGWNSQLSLNNDFEFSIRLLLHSEGVRWADKALYAYRKNLTPTLSGTRGQKAMASAYLTTSLGCDLLLARENSERIRRICADRYQMWLYQFFPDFPEIAIQAEKAVHQLGGSKLRIQGGRALQVLLPILGWKNIRRLQSFIYQYGWSAILARKERQRVQRIETA